MIQQIMNSKPLMEHLGLYHDDHEAHYQHVQMDNLHNMIQQVVIGLVQIELHQRQQYHLWW